MIIIKLKNGEEEWVDSYNIENVDGISWLKWKIKTKKGKTMTGAYQMNDILGYKDVGEKEEKILEEE